MKDKEEKKEDEHYGDFGILEGIVGYINVPVHWRLVPYECIFLPMAWPVFLLAVVRCRCRSILSSDEVDGHHLFITGMGKPVQEK